MATYKQPCIHCGSFIERDSRFCTSCGSRSPYGYLCPDCHKPIQQGQGICSGCGRTLTVPCPFCSLPTFVGGDKCQSCGESIMVRCDNPRCGKMQFFLNNDCTACGKKIKTGKKQILERMK